MKTLEIDWEQFDKLVWVPVISNIHLADILKVSIRTLERHVREKFEMTIDAVRQQKQGPMRHRLFSAMWKSAVENNNVTAQIWLSKNIFGWSDKMDHVQTVPGEKLIVQFAGGTRDIQAHGQVDGGEISENTPRCISDSSKISPR